jgi:hypothetical protein
MKAAVLFLFSLITIGSHAQDDLYYQAPKEPAAISNKANCIIITDSLTQQDYFKKITELLFESGYGVLNSDKEIGTITTGEKAFKNGTVKLNILIKDYRVVLRGDWKDNISIELYGVTAEQSWAVITHKGMKNSPYLNAWNEMNKIAVQIGSKREYLVKN